MHVADFSRNDNACFPVLRIAGEIDLAVRDQLGAALQQLVSEARSPAYIDMSAVTFFDSTGVNALIDAVQRARTLDVDVIITPSDYVSTTIGILGLTDEFHWGSPPAAPPTI